MNATKVSPRSRSASAAASSSTALPWTCPCCALLCDEFATPDDAATACPRARSTLQSLAATDNVHGLVDGKRVTVEAAIRAAAKRLAGWQQPLFAGLGTDVSGARALFRLAARTAAIVDHADGDAAMHGLRALQDRGQYTATIGEVHARAHTIVFVGTDGVTRQPRLLERLGLRRSDGPCRRVVWLGAAPPKAHALPMTAQHVRGSGDLHADVRQLAALVSRPRPAHGSDDLAALANELLASPYGVLLWEGASLTTQGALVVEMLNHVVSLLNKTTRAATFPLGGADGAASVNQAFTWLSGLPTRTRIARGGLEHDPHRHATTRLLARGACDGVLWTHAFDPSRMPPSTHLPRIVMGPPAMASRLEGPGVFIPVGTPGLGHSGHLFRTDGPVVLPILPSRVDGLRSVALVVAALEAQLPHEPKAGEPGIETR
jgi:formylmethanofuran dehydrogenase subunit B